MIVLDVETTGLNSNKNSLISIGAVNFSNGEEPATFYREGKVWDGSEIDPEALAVNGFTQEYIEGQQPHTELIKSFDIWSSSMPTKVLAGQDIARFDVPFLKTSYSKSGIDWKFGRRTVDLHSIGYVAHEIIGLPVPSDNGISKLGLDQTLSFVGLPEEPKPHNALIGAKLAAESFSRLIYGKGLFPEYSNFEMPGVLAK